MDDESSYDISVSADDEPPQSWPDALMQAAAATLRAESVSSAVLDIAVVDDEHIARLNQEHLDHAGPTDVLAFDLRDEPRDGVIDGQVVISRDTAAREAAARGHDVLDELRLYVVHGALHLAGLRDKSESDANEMRRREEAILESLGIGGVYARGERQVGS